MKYSLARAGLILIGILVGSLIVAPAARAESSLSNGSLAQTGSPEEQPAPIATRLTLGPLPLAPVGEKAVLTAHLTTLAGAPVANQTVKLLLDGEQVRQTRTDASGTATFILPKELSAGDYRLEVVFSGSGLTGLEASRASRPLKIVPALVKVQVVPPLAGVQFALDGRKFTSDANGLAWIDVREVGRYRLEIISPKYETANMRAELGRWGDEVFAPYREIEVPLDKPLEVGMEISYQVGQTFVDRQGRPVEPARVTSLVIKSSNGVTHNFEDGGPHWLPASRIVRRSGGLEETRILYSVFSVVVDGSNVVSQAQQRFFAHPDDVWEISLLLYSARFTTRDALFGFSVGRGVLLEYPDGHSEEISLGPDGEIELPSLARGLYRVTVVGVRGMASPTPVALSRDQDVQLPVVTYLDMAVVFCLMAALALGLLFVGRPGILIWLRTFVSTTASFGWRVVRAGKV